MKLMHGAIATVLFALSSPLWAAPKSVTLAVPGMTCPTCPVTIKKALMKEQGVASVTVRYEKKELVVSFDDAKTTPDAIMRSTAASWLPFPDRKMSSTDSGVLTESGGV